ncbi:NADH-dependent alcohol dehydrogenase [Microvirga sp. KLBC 81]|uniref:iron-containing alcohol dehydrogenase n=1 Tax=Microvirga sp. KLBC 81 TaxID=1862707 RepID=UPI000D51B7EB|nr:iron-containing alcohol dehydrogenase [Microvirga sp. KLBC 81]PVE22288.1 NADH-dependent alcohol dehydrogenase [Microvirga sp. KLBC 81]
MKFRICNPTDIRFGNGQIEALRELVPPNSRVLLLYGGGSIKSNGIYDQVMAGLKDSKVVEFGGVEPNPVYETLQKAAAVARENNVDLILGVGGGSVIDAAKFLATMVSLGSDDPWPDLAAGKLPATTLPVGAVLTLPATGSESNAVSVISSRERKLKLPFRNEAARPAFAILDPSTMQSLSRQQLENGVVDAFTHVLEQYLTSPVNAPIHYGYSETLLRVLAEWGPKLVETGGDEARENVMWAANQALNGLIGAGVPQDWSTHMIGHAITAVYNVDHARTLSVIMPSLMRYKAAQKQAMLARYGRTVWSITETDDAVAAEKAIEQTEQFFKTMGCPVRISELGLDFSPTDILEHLERAGQTALGENRDIDAPSVRQILSMAA